MLLPLRDPKKRARELELLAEYEAAGKIKRIDSKAVERKEVVFPASVELLEEIGNDDGNFRVMTINQADDARRGKID